MIGFDLNGEKNIEIVQHRLYIIKKTLEYMSVFTSSSIVCNIIHQSNKVLYYFCFRIDILQKRRILNMNLYFKNRMMKAGLLSLMAGAAVLLPIVANAESYTVKSGDTLSAIATSHQTTVDKIAQKNKISNIDLISVGQVLELDDNVSEQMTFEKSDKTEQSAVNPSSGLSAEDAEAKEWIAQKESSGSYTAQNGQYYGRYQLTITYLNGDLSPENQEKTADAYVAGRYGSWSAAKNFWLANGWY